MAVADLTKADEISRLLNGQFGSLVGRSVERTLIQAESNTKKIQKQFFKTMVGPKVGIIGDTKQRMPFPGGSGMTLSIPTWPELNFEYTEYKKKNSKFFFYKGQMKETLKGLDAETIFGTPTVKYIQKGLTSKGNEARQVSQLKDNFLQVKIIGGSGKTVKTIKNIESLGQLEIDFYPKWEHSLRASFGDDFYKKFFSIRQTRYGKGRRPVFLSYKLRNRDNHRPFMGQYMEWWMKTQASKILKQGVSI